MGNGSGAAGLAALSVCESILLSLTENGIVDEAEVKAILTDAATAHRQAAPPAGASDHDRAAVLIEALWPADGGCASHMTAAGTVRPVP